MARLELAASCSQSRRATNCATPGYFVVLSGWAYSPKAGAIPVAVPCKSGVRQSGLAFCRPRPRARLPQSATGGGRLASPLGYTRVCRTYRQGILYMKPRKNATPKCGNPAASRNAEIRRRPEMRKSGGVHAVGAGEMGKPPYAPGIRRFLHFG